MPIPFTEARKVCSLVRLRLKQGSNERPLSEAQIASPPLQPSAEDEILKAEVRARLSLNQG